MIHICSQDFSCNHYFFLFFIVYEVVWGGDGQNAGNCEFATAGAKPSVEAREQSEEQVVAARNGEETREEVEGVRVRAEAKRGQDTWDCGSVAVRQMGPFHHRLRLAQTDAGV